LGLGLLLFAKPGPSPAQPPAKGEQGLDQAAVDESIARAIEYLRSVQKEDGTWDDGGHVQGCTALAGLALIENGVRLSDPAITRAAAQVRSKASSLNDTYQIALTIMFLDRLRDPKRDDQMIQILGARLIGGQTMTGGWTYDVAGGPRQLARI